jgi:hypothetical protein
VQINWSRNIQEMSVVNMEEACTCQSVSISNIDGQEVVALLVAAGASR